MPTIVAGAFLAALATAILLLPAAAQGPSAAAAEGSPGLVAIDPPAQPGSGFPAIASENVTTLRRGHDVLLTWLEPGEGGGTGRLRFSRFTGEGWTQPITVAEPVALPAPGDRPSLTLLDTQAVRRTLIARIGDVVARSGDAGRTWTRLPAPPLRYASFAGGDEGGYVFWLEQPGDGPARLLGTRAIAGEALLDPRVAEASGTAAAMTWDGPVVAYLDESADGARSIAVVHREDAQWSPPGAVFAGGPDAAGRAGSTVRMAAVRRQVVVAWVADGPEGAPRVLVAFSTDAARTFGAPVEVDAGDGDGRGPTGSVDVALSDDGSALVVWPVATGSGRADLNLARVVPGGDRSDELVLASGLSSGRETSPQVVRAGDEVAVTWVEGDPWRIRAATVSVAAVPAPDGRRRAARSEPAVKKRKPYVGRGVAGDPLPDVELTNLEGEAVSLESLEGRPVLVNLWATWCVPCIAEMPELAEIQERFGPEGLAVVGVSVDDGQSSDRVRAFVSERKVAIPVWLDPKMQIPDALRVRGLPATFVADRTGRIVLRREGTVTAHDPELLAAIRRALQPGA